MRDKTRPKDAQGVGEIRVDGAYTIGPGSTHPNGNLYEIFDARPLTFISEEELREAFKQYIKQPHIKSVETVKPAHPSPELDALTIADVCRAYGIALSGGDETRTSHPIHGSKSGTNFVVNTAKNVWRCHRCQTGGGPIQLIAVLEGIFECEDSEPGALRGDEFVKTLDAARKKGLLKEYTPRVNTGRNTPNDKNKIFNPTPTREAYSLEAQKRAKEPMSDTFVSKTLGKTIKHDEENKLIVFYSMGQNYTFEDQQNIMFSAPSATGKSYIALEVANYFPKEDVDKKGYTSRKAFFHMNSVLETVDGQPLQDHRTYVEERLGEWIDKNPKPSDKITRTKKTRDGEKTEEIRNPDYTRWKESRKNEYRRLRDEWDSIEKIYVVNLEKRIIIWKDTPDDQVLQPLRSLISHDEKELIADITDKSTSGGNLTKKVKLLGYPTVVFCQAAFSPDEQERTRFFIISPDMSQEKLTESLNLQAESLKDRGRFKKILEEDADIAALKARIELIKAANIQQIIISKEDMDNLLEWFKGNDKPRDLAPRDQRDFPHLVAMAKGHALFNLPQRDYTPGETLTAKTEDIDSAKTICVKIIESNRLGLPPYAYDWWSESLSGLLEAAGDEGLTKTHFSQSYYSRFNTRLSDKSRKRLITLFEEAGFLEEKTDLTDKRTTKLYALGVGVGYKIKNNSRSSGAKTCARCSKPFKEGDSFALIEGFYYCQSCKAEIVQQKLGGIPP